VDIASSDALNHDIGYIRGICAGDTAEHFVIDAAGNTVTPPRGPLMPRWSNRMPG